MDSLYLILLALFLLVIIPWIMRQRRLAAVRHILNQNVNERKYLPNLVRLGRPCNYTMDSAKKTAGGSQTYLEPKNAE